MNALNKKQQESAHPYPYLNIASRPSSWQQAFSPSTSNVTFQDRYEQI